MIKIDYPETKPQVKAGNEREFIFCMIRKRWILLTPEEWVRQNFLLYVTEVLHYPSSLIAVEKQLMLGDLKKRFDIVVYNKEARPFMIVECKEMNIPLSASVLQQVLRYNINVNAAYIVVTNGSYCGGFEKKEMRFYEMEELPVF